MFIVAVLWGVRVSATQGDLFVNGNRVVLRQIPFDRGVLYGINGVLRPPGEGGDCDVATTQSVWVSNSYDMDHRVIIPLF